MTDQQEIDLERLLDGVWQRRRAELLARVRLLANYLDDCPREPGAWAALGAEAHRLVGALGSLGFDELARALRLVESDACRTAVAPDDVSALRAVITDVQDALAAATARPAS